MFFDVAGNSVSFEHGARSRLSPTMRSRKLQALDFIKRYFAQWGVAPSLSEIGAALGVSRQHASDLVHQLSIDKQIRHIAGKARGISLPDPKEQISEADALRALARQGWTINARPPAARDGEDASLTKFGLLGLPYLDHDPA